MKKYVLGIGLLVLSGLVLFQNYLLRIDVTIWKLAFILAFAAGLVNNLIQKRLHGSFFFGTGLFILLNKQYHFLAVDTKTVVMGAILAYLGVSILLKPKQGDIRLFTHLKSKSTGKSAWVEDENNIAFGSSTRYIHDTHFTYGNVDAAFGNATIYFNHTVMAGEEATFEVDAAFSTIHLYVPETWLVQVKADKAFSTIQQASQPTVFEKKLVVKADLAFSNLVIVSS
ncbi:MULTISPECIES: hypothetical protein [unclassified Streptococcus]|uniref:LiaF transmembrane domain-containing protein n=1 Tax=unclassified Streptococcus TaxID=2608887 RepID=UPI001072A6B1|nr:MULTISPECIES: hypothetical protein [unclassified Streptococcus]MBF0787422.1 hypothetical protein [Streptococcus sp. 19428wC2_LYSM12]MCQ9211753.1 hypothetical protein [Streptococcus sp. B01]MCQ9213058.1 hypothetical protein [Streptococcus sp. O1]TFV05643.1 hypothetical protein E4T79_05895 [Streptococcus sp. LYSM12]